MIFEFETIQAKVDLGGTVTRDEAEYLVRSVTRTCKGPVKRNKVAEYGELRRGAGNFGGGEKGYDIGLVDSLNRIPCGADFNDVICAFPFDGAERRVRCPNCKQVISFRSPFFNIVK